MVMTRTPYKIYQTIYGAIYEVIRELIYKTIKATPHIVSKNNDVLGVLLSTQLCTQDRERIIKRLLKEKM